MCKSNICEFWFRQLDTVHHLTRKEDPMTVKSLNFERNCNDTQRYDKVLMDCTASVTSLCLNQAFGNDIMNRIIDIPAEDFSLALSNSVKNVSVLDLDARSKYLDESSSHVSTLIDKLWTVLKNFEKFTYSIKLSSGGRRYHDR